MCAVSCYSHSSCDLYHYSTVSNECAIFSQQIKFNPSIDTTSNAGWSFGYIQQHYTSGEWTLVFRAKERNGVPVYQTWLNSSQQDDHPITKDFPEACLRTTDYSQCDRHFRSDILDNWSGIEEVKYSLVKNDVEVAFIVFYSVGSTMLTWFTHSRILNSTWTPTLDEEMNLEPMSVEGFCGASCRRFHTHVEFDRCRRDYFYTFVIDANFDNCDQGTLNWDVDLIDTTTFPIFVYAPGTGPASYGIDRGSMDTAQEADALFIWVKFA